MNKTTKLIIVIGLIVVGIPSIIIFHQAMSYWNVPEEYKHTDNYFGKSVDCAYIDGEQLCDSGLDGEFVTHWMCGNSTEGYSTYDSRDIDNDSFCIASQVYCFGEELEEIKRDLEDYSV